MFRYQLFHEWHDRILVGRDISHALVGRSLEGITYYEDGRVLSTPKITIASVEGTRENPTSTRGDKTFRTAIVLDDKDMAHEIDYIELGEAF